MKGDRLTCSSGVLGLEVGQVFGVFDVEVRFLVCSQLGVILLFRG